VTPRQRAVVDEELARRIAAGDDDGVAVDGARSTTRDDEEGAALRRRGVGGAHPIAQADRLVTAAGHISASFPPLSDGVDARIGARVAGRFLVEERIGAGAAGVVYRAVQEPLGRRVALKMLSADNTGDAKRLAREAQAIARLRHENVVVVHDVGEDAGTAFIAMEYVEGTTLRAILDEGALPIDTALGIVRGAASGLAHAHQNGVVHRDLKPQNIMLAGGKRDSAAVRVVDFGLARVSLTEGGEATDSVSASIEGTPAYMAPEQIEPKPHAPVGPASDVYALGVVLYEALTGTNPFRAETPFKSLLRHVEGPVPPAPSTWRSDVPPHVDALVTRMLQKTASARPSAADVVAALAPSSLPVDRGEPQGLSLGERAAWPRYVALAALIGIIALVVRAQCGIAERASHVDAGPPPVAAPTVVDAGIATIVDAGAVSVVDAGTKRSRPVPRPPPVVDAGVARAPSPLERKVRALSTCSDACVADVTSRMDAALAG
jgi:eukaryotic-like serine/threonine-protein kinase